jgi:hypothetical protein
LDSWLEIKPKEPTENEMKKTAALSLYTKKPVFTFWNIEEPGYVDHPEGYWDNGQKFAICKNCRKVQIVFEGRTDRLVCHCQQKQIEEELAKIPRFIESIFYRTSHAIVDEAVTKALSARFEFGEKP